MTTTEQYLQAARSLVLDHAITRGAITPEEADRLAHTKLLYGSGAGLGARGVTFYGTWSNGHETPTDVVEICAVAQETWIQLAGTLVHEMGHALAGHDAGHAIAWKDTTIRLGFRLRPAAAGQVYRLAMFEPTLRHALVELAHGLDDGSPLFSWARPGAAGGTRTVRPCGAGIGTRGGTSRGKGSGSRMLKVVCPEDGYTVRTTRRWLDVGAPMCPAGHTMREE